jgi:lactate dehydrogenase-like 2-hydroxyacid dehydrogenase
LTDKPLLLLAQPHLGFLQSALAPHYDLLCLWEDPAADALARVRAMVAAGEYAIAPALVDRLPALGLIACFTVGYDGIDVDWARARGIEVGHAQDANGEDVADHAIGLIVGHVRRIVAGDRMLRAGDWHARAKMLTPSLSTKRLGIVGMGAIGRALAARAEAMRMAVRWWGPHAKPGLRWDRADSLVALARDSDVLVVAARAHGGNDGLIDAAVIDALGPDGLLVNVARGQLVDEAALIAALRDGRLGGAALDVYATEPTPAERWADVPNTVLTPHTAGATEQAVAAMTQMLLANLAAFFADAPIPFRAA